MKLRVLIYFDGVFDKKCKYSHVFNYMMKHIVLDISKWYILIFRLYILIWLLWVKERQSYAYFP